MALIAIWYEMTACQRIKLGPDRVLEPMSEADLDEVLAIEAASFKNPWVRKAFLAEIKGPNAYAWVVRDEAGPEKVAGYVCFWEMAEKVHLLNLCVAPDYRRRTLGRLLVDFVVSWARMRAKNKVVLEVRQGNEAALILYQGHGFRRAGLCRGYYSDTGEDAILMDMELFASSGDKT